MQGRTSVGGGAGEVGEAFRAPGMRVAEDGASGGAGKAWFSRFFHERPERKVGVGVHFSPSRVIS